jgi:hypothetical protein
VRDTVDVNTAGGNVGCDQHPASAVLESAKSLIALALTAVAVNGRRLNSMVGKPSSQPIGAVPGPGEYQERTFVSKQKPVEEPEFTFLFHFVKTKVDPFGGLCGGAHLDPDTPWDVNIHQMLDRAFDGRGKKQSLAVGWKEGQNPFEDRKKAHVEHSVRLVEHQDLNAIQIDEPAAEKVV